jgi:hypothetical protein
MTMDAQGVARAASVLARCMPWVSRACMGLFFTSRAYTQWAWAESLSKTKMLPKPIVYASTSGSDACKGCEEETRVSTGHTHGMHLMNDESSKVGAPCRSCFASGTKTYNLIFPIATRHRTKQQQQQLQYRGGTQASEWLAHTGLHCKPKAHGTMIVSTRARCNRTCEELNKNTCMQKTCSGVGMTS